MDNIEQRLQELREEVHGALTQLDEKLREVKDTAMVANHYGEKARNTAYEALSEIRNIRTTLTTEANTKPSPETRRVKGPSRSRGRRA